MALQPILVVIMLILQSGTEPENPWKEKVAEAVQAAERNPTPTSLWRALDATWRADDWQAGLRLSELALKRHANEPRLQAPVARALWRAGRVADAEAAAAKIPKDTDDALALRTLITLRLARGDIAAASELAQRLHQQKRVAAEDLYAVFAARFAANRLEGLADVLRKTERLTDAKNGYPEMYITEAIEGLPKFLDAVGTEPFNQLAQPGSAPMQALVMLNLPCCDVLINGKGPYRLIIDTGGSIMVALDQAVADEIGLKSIAQASVRGVSGTSESGQALIDELTVGSIRLQRVLTRVFGVREAIMNAADGIIGTGIFGQGRMTLDFAGAQLTIAPSSTASSPGVSAELLLVGDAKLIAPIMLQGQPAVALLDSGADVVALSPARLKVLFPDQPIQEFNAGIPIGVGSGEMPTITLGSGVDIVFAGKTYEKYSGLGLDVLDVTLGPILGIQSDVLLGMPTFREMRSFTVDFPQCKMWIEWLSRD